MKKILVLFITLLLTFSTKVFATGLGPQVNFNFGFTPGHASYGYTNGGVALSAKFDSLPVYWAFSMNFAKTGLTYIDNDFTVHNPWRINIGATADYWFLNKEIIGLWHWYWGVGGAADIGFTTYATTCYIGVGPRVLIGMNWFFMDGFMELYAQQVAQPMIQFAIGPDGTDNGVFRFPIYFPAEVGLRFYF
ncbi:MAG: hypothetical protein IKI31_01600 [Treponema sp.]|nr:hypothetical protein [Treponema sp.]